MIIAKHFYMIRHGETEANVAKIMAGSMDSPLTQNGIDQAKKAAGIVSMLNNKPKTIVHSHLSRARDTANHINALLNAPIYEDPDFAELNAGDWEGVPYDQCQELLVGWQTPPGGESFNEFCERLKRAKNTHLQRHPGPVLIVCHGGVFRAFGKIYGLNMPGVKNCHLYEFEPLPNTETFPWRVWEYGLNNEGGIIRNIATVYHNADTAEIES